MPPLPHQLGQLLLRRGAITEAQLDQALVWQQAHPMPIGAALLQLGAIDQRTLDRALRQQKWLRPCAACFALIAPLSTAWAADQGDEGDVFHSWNDRVQWQLGESEHVSQHTASVDLVKFVALTAWDIYQGAPETGEMRFNLSQTGKSAYQLEMTVHF
ncbi:hypothetical protein ACQUQU_16835 [Thalassolituus sp. LLYu03]|uniref:hypothetical protein n=1 Tax=Thalassolituus sp. LLYu03 TaxID=3421656 RepID=UPI003D284369